MSENSDGFNDLETGAVSFICKCEGENVFLYLDPPCCENPRFTGKTGNLYKSFDHEKFADSMRNCGHKQLLTYDDSDHVRDLFSFAEITS